MVYTHTHTHTHNDTHEQRKKKKGREEWLSSMIKEREKMIKILTTQITGTKKLEIRLARVTLYIICHNTSGTSSHLSHSTDICRFVRFLWIIIGFSPWMNHLNNTFANCFRATPFL